MRKGHNGKRKKKRKKKEKNGVFSGHYVIASSLPPERLRPNDDRWNAARSCQYHHILIMRVQESAVGTTSHTPSLTIFSHDRGEGRYFLWGSNLALHSVPFFMLGYDIFYKLALVTAEILLIWTYVARTNVAWTNVTLTVGICSECSQEPTFKVSSKSGH